MNNLLSTLSNDCGGSTIDVIEKFLSNHPNEELNISGHIQAKIDKLCVKGNKKQADGIYKEAIASFEAALALVPSPQYRYSEVCGWILTALADAYHDDKQFENAIKCSELSIVIPWSKNEDAYNFFILGKAKYFLNPATAATDNLKNLAIASSISPELVSDDDDVKPLLSEIKEQAGLLAKDTKTMWAQADDLCANDAAAAAVKYLDVLKLISSQSIFQRNEFGYENLFQLMMNHLNALVLSKNYAGGLQAARDIVAVFTNPRKKGLFEIRNIHVVGNPLFHLLVGMIKYEQSGADDINNRTAGPGSFADEFASALIGGGRNMFTNEDEKYLRVTLSLLKPPPPPQEEGCAIDMIRCSQGFVRTILLAKGYKL